MGHWFQHVPKLWPSMRTYWQAHPREHLDDMLPRGCTARDAVPDEDPLDTSKSKDKNGAMLGLAYTQKLTNTIYARGSLYYFDIDYGGVIEEPIRFGIDVIWDF